MFVRKRNDLVREVGCLLTAEDDFRLVLGATLDDDLSRLQRITKIGSAPLKLNLVGGKEYDRLFEANRALESERTKNLPLGTFTPLKPTAKEEETASALACYTSQVREAWLSALASADYRWYDQHGDLTANRPEMQSALHHIGLGHDTLHRNGRGVYYVAGASLEQCEYFGRKNGQLKLFLALQGSQECGLVTIDSEKITEDLRLRITIHPSIQLSRKRMRAFDYFLECQAPESSRDTRRASCKVTVYGYKDIHCLVRDNQAGDRFEYRLSEAEEIGSGFQHQYAIRTLEIEDEPILRPIL